MPAVSVGDRGRVFLAVICIVALCIQRVRSSPSPEGSWVWKHLRRSITAAVLFVAEVQLLAARNAGILVQPIYSVPRMLHERLCVGGGSDNTDSNTASATIFNYLSCPVCKASSNLSFAESKWDIYKCALLRLTYDPLARHNGDFVSICPTRRPKS